MEKKCMKLNKPMLILCVLELWINQFHKEKKIKYVAILNIIFSVFFSLFLSVITYLITIIFMFISMSENERSKYNFFYFSSFRSIYLICITIFLIVCFQNLYNTNFNIANKIKVLISALLYDITVERLFLNLFKVSILYLGGLLILTYTILTIFEPYVGSVVKTEFGFKNIFNVALIVSLIIIFLIQVYGIEDSFKSSRRKIVIYSISTIIVAITSLNSISKMNNELDFNYVFSIEFISLIIALILSVDRIASSLKIITKEYITIYRQELCETCVVKDISPRTVKNNFEDIIKKIIYNTTFIYKEIKKLSFSRKVILILYFILMFIILRYINVVNIEKYENLIANKFTVFLNNIYSLIMIKFEINLEYFIAVLFKSIFIMVVLVLCILSIKSVMTNIKKVSRQIRYRKIDKIHYEEIYKDLMNIGCNSYFTVMLIMLPSISNGLLMSKFVISLFKVISSLIISLFLIAFVFYLLDKISKKNDQYKYDE